ncbi:MAG: response regulator transcription factor [Pedobacter sp.]|nr:response regulator transcription factor [Pedobacter sp.]
MSPLEKPHALILEDKPEVNGWLCSLVRQAFPAYTTVSAHSLQAARAKLAEKTDFRLALLDLGLPDGSGIDLIRELQVQRPEISLIVTTVHGDDDNLFGAIAAGAQGYLLKEQPEALFLLQLRQLEQGQPPLSPSIARRMLEYFRQQAKNTAMPESSPDDVHLTPRETDVLAGIGRGLRVSEVAQQLGLADSTVSSYIKNIYFKLNISSRAEAALEAARRGLT